MTGVRVELGNPDDFDSAQAYIEQHLAPVVTELHRITNELFAPGSTAEECAVDMIPTKVHGIIFSRLDRRLKETDKHVSFDGTQYFTLPTKIQLTKQVKVHLTAVCYVKTRGAAGFRLVRSDGMYIENSFFECSSLTPVTVTRILPFGDTEGSISPELHDYMIEARYIGERVLPVCRRFSLSFVYI